MSYRKWTSLFVFFVMISTTSSAGMVGGQFEITKSTIDGGGGRSSGTQFTLTGTIGQPDAGLQPMSGAEFKLYGGFWPNGQAIPLEKIIFEDGFEEPL